MSTSSSDTHRSFEIVSDFTPSGDQPEAIDRLAAGIKAGVREQILLGVTGSGKTLTMAQVVTRVQRPTLVIAPNKTLAAQLFAEFRELFPHNAVEYFVSYYDYYQPEAYIPASDTYIEKDSSINDAIDKMRHSATRSLLTRSDVLIVASVSCIYGLGSPEEYRDMHLFLRVGEEYPMEEVLRRLAFMLYERNDYSFHRGTFRARGDVLDIFPVHEEERAVRVEFFGDTIDAIALIDPLRGEILADVEEMTVFPGSHFVTSQKNLKSAMRSIQDELQVRLSELQGAARLVEAQRLEQRTLFDLEMIAELGYCNGIENYSRHLTGKPSGVAPPNLLDYFPDDYLLVIDESHIAVPQIGGMYKGDRSRKETLVEYGFRLPSALDNRPLRFDEFERRIHQVVYVSATPGPYELKRAKDQVVEQLIRPTGLLDPRIEVRPALSQVDDLLEEIRVRTARNEAVLVTTLTKRMAEDLTQYYEELGVRVRYLHSDVKTLERVELIRDLRQRHYDVLIGINLLREGLDIPEVSLVAVLDADKEGFLRSERSLVQTCGRAARNVEGTVILYADAVTPSMRATIDETNRRRTIQERYNQEHGITPRTIISEIKDAMAQHLRASGWVSAEDPAGHLLPATAEPVILYHSVAEIQREIAELEKKMFDASRQLAFEEAAGYRDRIRELRMMELAVG
ncbi:MAG: excinuclease ABC subunit UvrB [Desulfobulbus sp.]|nr:excinuclease ABC subunit UvrB [Desulfobulbus sp.]